MLLCQNGKMNRCCCLPLSLALLFIMLMPSGSLVAGDMVLPEGTRICLQLNNHISTRSNSEGDPFKAIVTEPVYLGDHMVIPKGSEVRGSISRIQRPGRFKGKAAMTLLFQSINIPGHGELPIAASLTGVDREGNRGISTEGTIEGEGSEGKDVGRVLTPGLVGAGIGGIAGGGRGAAIGAGAGVAIGLATVFTSRGKDIEMRRGSVLDISLDKPLFVPQEVESPAARNR